MGGVRDRDRRPRGRARGRVRLRHGRGARDPEPAADGRAPGDPRRLLPGGRAASPRLGARDHGWRVERFAAPTPRRGCRARSRRDLLWLESPTNPLLEIADIAAICAAPRKPARAWSSTTRSPRRCCSSRSTLGADLVIHAATKFIGGHSDLLIGVAITADARQQYELLRTRADAQRRHARARSSASSPCAALRTLPVRLKQRRSASAAGAAWSGWGRIRPCTASATRGFGAVVSFELADAETVDRACAARQGDLERHEPGRRRDDDGAAAASIPGRSTSRPG